MDDIGRDGEDLVGGYACVLLVIGLLAMALGVLFASEGGREARLGWALIAAGGVVFLGASHVVAMGRGR